MDFTLSEELTMIREMARDFVTNELLPVEREVLVREKGGSRGAPIPSDKRERLKKLAVEQGLWGMTAPESLGGGGLSTLGACLVAEELGKTFVDFDFGDIPPILFDGSAELQARYLAPALAGEIECVLAVQEPDWDGAAEVRTLAVREGEDWRITGTKLAGPADVYLVLARAEQGLTCLIVERAGPGVTAENGTLKLENAPVAGSNVLGAVGGALTLGRKYQDARAMRAAARKVGIACRLLEASSQYARDWKALGQPLAVRPSVQRDLAEMATEIDAARWLVYHAACEIDEGKEAGEHVRRAGLYASEMVRRAIDRTIAIHGGPTLETDLPMLRIYGAQVKPGIAQRILELQRALVASNLIDNSP